MGRGLIMLQNAWIFFQDEIDVMKIMVLLGFLILMICYIQAVRNLRSSLYDWYCDCRILFQYDTISDYLRKAGFIYDIQCGNIA